MIEIITPKDWESARAFAQEFFEWGGNWGFRGQHDASWSLVTSFERLAHKLPEQSLLETELAMLDHFRRRAHLYISDPPANKNNLEWLAMIQHYGGPSRLLDFSRSFYVAVFFAIERAGTDGAVWAIWNDRKKEVEDTELENYFDLVNEGKSPQDLRVSRVEPKRMNQRLSIQQGFFLFPYNISRPFVDNLAGTLGISPEEAKVQMEKTEPTVDNAKQAKEADPKVVKITLKTDLHRSILSDLKAMNVTHESLYPGLAGFAQSLYFHMALSKERDNPAQ